MNSTTESAGYTYDLLGRLVTSSQGSNGASADRQFVYDRWGNRTEVHDGLPGGKDPPTLIQSITLQQSGGAPTNRITSVTSGSTVNYSHDAAGNVTNDGAHSYKYDAENRIVKVDDGATAEYRYDHQNRRVTKVVGSSWTHYIWEGGQVIGEHDATTPLPGYGEPPYQEQSARLDYIYSGGRMIRSRQRSSSTGPWTPRYFLSDRLSARMTLDTSGNVLGRQAHLPFGEDFAESGTHEKHHFTNYERDPESLTEYAVNRQYLSGLGRFNRPDPVAGSAAYPQSLNRYSYVRGDPTNAIDPLGLESRPIPTMIIPLGCSTLFQYEDGNIFPVRGPGGAPVKLCAFTLVSLVPIGGGGGGVAGEPQNRKKKAKFSLAKFKQCAEDLFGAQIQSFSTDGTSVEVFGPDSVRNDGNNATYTVTFDFSNTGAQIAQMPPPSALPWLYGAYFPTNPYTVFIANDIAAHTGNSNPILVIATQVHELAHALSFIGGVAGDADLDEAGERMEKCVFGGIVEDDGYVYF